MSECHSVMQVTYRSLVAAYPEMEYFMVNDPLLLFILAPTFTCWKNATPSPMGGCLVCVCDRIKNEGIARHPQQAKWSTQPPAGDILPEAGRRTILRSLLSLILPNPHSQLFPVNTNG
jgi:hypothetical protein